MVSPCPHSSPVFEVVLQLPAGQCLVTVSREGAGDGQLIQQLQHQQAGVAAGLQHQRLAVHGAEVALQQEAGQALLPLQLHYNTLHLNCITYYIT